jgi:hypothetical protein
VTFRSVSSPVPSGEHAPPKQTLELVGKPVRIIFHHTASHHKPEISGPGDESLAESIRYAHAIQDFHMDTCGWNDSGHNFLVCRNGVVLQGRWLTVSALEAGHMVRSAHCAQAGKPGSDQNDQIGIEHEHAGTEAMTLAQMLASAELMVWIAQKLNRRTVMPVEPHSRYCDTACPANLTAQITTIRHRAQAIFSA